MLKTIIILAALTTTAVADDYKPTIEPPLGPISPTGTVVEVESIRCAVTSPYSIECINIGRVCVAARAEENKRSARIFGCAIEGNKNYPCPKDEPQNKEKDDLRWHCIGTHLGPL